MNLCMAIYAMEVANEIIQTVPGAAGDDPRCGQGKMCKLHYLLLFSILAACMRHPSTNCVPTSPAIPGTETDIEPLTVDAAKLVVEPRLRILRSNCRALV